MVRVESNCLFTGQNPNYMQWYSIYKKKQQLNVHPVGFEPGCSDNMSLSLCSSNLPIVTYKERGYDCDL